MTISERVKNLSCHRFFPHAAIGIFDSGIGGLTVLQALHRLLPHENLIYFGDTAHVPYGSKSAQTVERYSRKNVDFLLRKGIKALVIACNTATAHAGNVLKATLPVPVIGVIEPGVDAAVNVTKNGQIAVLATRGTLNSGVYQRLLKERLPNSSITSIECPLFVPIVEEGMAGHSLAKMTVEHYLSPLKNSRVDTVLLGCTHYPLLRSVIEEFLGNDVTVIDSAASCAKVLASEIETSYKINSRLGSCEYYVTDDPVSFEQVAQSLLEIPQGPVKSVFDELYSSPYARKGHYKVVLE